MNARCGWAGGSAGQLQSILNVARDDFGAGAHVELLRERLPAFHLVFGEHVRGAVLPTS